MVKLALIGAGNHCRGNHAPALAKYATDHPDRVALVGVCDLESEKAERFVREFGFQKAFTDYREMMEEAQPDGCVCVMPIQHIVPLAKALMQMGMPVTVEKPPGVSIAESRELVEVARETGVTHMVSVNRRLQPLIQRAKQWALEQGPLRYVRASILRHNRREDFFISGTGIHCVDTLREIGGEIADYKMFTQEGEPDWYHVVFRFASGAIGTLDILPSDGSVEERYELFGEGYRVDARVQTSAHPRVRCWKDNHIVVDERPPEGEPDFMRLGPYAETHEFVCALEEGRPAWPTIEDVFPSLELAYKLDPSKPE
ncbi:MAG: Gfo/Idh/MocA family oxidoreductase [bacterium]|nr:Gfo/Idh/MocA family oxidoreductase [bacterium]